MTDRPTPETSEKDKVRPYHARDSASGQEAAEAVAAVLKHAAERDEAAKKKVEPKSQPKWMLPLGLNLGVLAVYLLIAPPSWVVVNPIAPPPEEEVVENLMSGMYFYASKIESYRTRTGRLPATLTEAGIAATGQVSYSLQGDSTFVLVATIGDQDLVWNSSTVNPVDWAPNLSRRIGG